MLTKKQYEALCKYRDSITPASKTIDEMTAYFLQRNFIVRQTFEHTEHKECDVTYQKSVWLLALPGELALREYEEHQAQLLEQRIWQSILVFIGLLTLAATILK